MSERVHRHRHRGHEGHGHATDLRAVSRRRLWWAMAIILVFLVVEVVGGLITGSLALLADAGHMLTDVLALAMAIFVGYLAERPATPERTFGFLRAEVIGAFINGATLILVVGLVFREAIGRFLHPAQVAGVGMLAVAVAGLLANVASAWVLSGSRKENINIEGAFVHMLADTLGSVGAVAAGVVDPRHRLDDRRPAREHSDWHGDPVEQCRPVAADARYPDPVYAGPSGLPRDPGRPGGQSSTSPPCTICTSGR